MSIFALLLCTASLANESTQADKQIKGNNSVTVVTETIESRKKDMKLSVSQDLMKTAFYKSIVIKTANFNIKIIYTN